jgi:hypothetical protein
MPWRSIYIYTYIYTSLLFPASRGMAFGGGGGGSYRTEASKMEGDGKGSNWWMFDSQTDYWCELWVSGHERRKKVSLGREMFDTRSKDLVLLLPQPTLSGYNILSHFQWLPNLISYFLLSPNRHFPRVPPPPPPKITNFMQQRPSSEANSSSASQKISRILWNPKIITAFIRPHDLFPS